MGVRPVVRVRARPQCIFSQSPHLRAACIFSLGRPTFATLRPNLAYFRLLPPYGKGFPFLFSPCFSLSLTLSPSHRHTLSRVTTRHPTTDKRHMQHQQPPRRMQHVTKSIKQRDVCVSSRSSRVPPPLGSALRGPTLVDDFLLDVLPLDHDLLLDEGAGWHGRDGALLLEH